MPTPDARTLETSAVYENGTLKFERPLPIKPGERIRVTLHIEPAQIQRLPRSLQRQLTHEEFEAVLKELEGGEPT